MHSLPTVSMALPSGNEMTHWYCLLLGAHAEIDFSILPEKVCVVEYVTVLVFVLLSLPVPLALTGP